jgi:hypothetical protein
MCVRSDEQQLNIFKRVCISRRSEPSSSVDQAKQHHTPLPIDSGVLRLHSLLFDIVIIFTDDDYYFWLNLSICMFRNSQCQRQAFYD